jgi:mono/diheme cytochrome c family protein
MLRLDIKSAICTIGLSFLLSVALTGCGGSSPIAGPGPDHVNQVTGVAATGAPIIGKVTLKDSSSPAVELTTSTASDGSFAFDTTKLASPFIIRTTSGTHTYFSLADSGSGIHNVNPLTTVIVSLAAGGVDLDTLYTAGSSSALASIMLNLPTAETTVQTALAPILDQFGVTGSLMNSTYVADHTGVDAIFDVLNISIAAGTVTLTNTSNSAVVFTAPADSIASFKTHSVVVANIPAVPVQSWGSELYRDNCKRCHGDIMNSSVIGRSSVAAIMGGITSDTGGMGSLGELTYEAIVAISDAISTVVVPVVAPGSLSGETLYANKCANCHKPLATSKKLGITTVRLQDAIANNVGKMGFLSSLSVADINSIVQALSTTTATPTTPTTPIIPTTLDGVAIYAANCESCHSALATSTKTGMTAARYANGVSKAAKYMGNLNLSPAEISVLIDVLATTTPTPTPTTPPDGATIYATNCEGCHPLGTSRAKIGLTVARFSAALSNPANGMDLVPAMSMTDITALINFTATLVPPPTTVTPTYANTCEGAGCHLPLNSTNKGGKTAAQIFAAINGNTGGMGFLSSTFSTVAQLDPIALELSTILPPVVADNGPALYTAHCEGCHGLYTASGKGGKTTQLIQAAIAANTGAGSTMGGMKTTDLQSLTTNQIDLIATLLGTVTPVAKNYATQCASCHNPIAPPPAVTSTKGGATAAKITASIAANRGGMGYLSTLTPAEITAIAAELAGVTGPKCSTCHAVIVGKSPNLSSGQHRVSNHSSKTCATCHGTGYTTTGTITSTTNTMVFVSTPLTHFDGTKNILVVTGTTLGITKWNAPVLSVDPITQVVTVKTKGSCTASCHNSPTGTRTW